MNKKGFTSLVPTVLILVILAGIMGYFYFAKKPFATPSQDETATWKNFVSNLGFNFRYPIDKVVMICVENKINTPINDCKALRLLKKSVKLDEKAYLNPDVDFMDIYVYDNKEHISLEDFEAQSYNFAHKSPNYSFNKITEGKVANRRALFEVVSAYEHEQKQKFVFIALSEDKIQQVIISMDYFDGMTQLYEQILSTFTFVQ